MYDHSGQKLEIELFDEDTDKDDFLGRYGTRRVLDTYFCRPVRWYDVSL